MKTKNSGVVLLLGAMSFAASMTVMAGSIESDPIDLALAGGGGLMDAGLLKLSAYTEMPIYGKKSLMCKEVVGPNTKYNPDSLDSQNVLIPRDYAIFSKLKLELDKEGGPTEAYMAKKNNLMQNVQVTVAQPPKHGTLLPVQVNQSKGFFFMAEQGYFGLDKIVFSVKFNDGQTVLLTTVVSVVGNPSHNSQDPCPATPSEYQEWRQKNPEEIKRNWEGLNETLNESGQDYVADDSGAWGLIGWATGQQEVTDQFVWNNADPLATVLANASLSFAGFADLAGGALINGSNQWGQTRLIHKSNWEDGYSQTPPHGHGDRKSEKFVINRT